MTEEIIPTNQFTKTWSLFHDLDFKLSTMLNHLNDKDTVMDASMGSFLPLSLEMIKCEISLVKACLNLVSAEEIEKDPESFCMKTFITTEMLRDLKISYNKYRKFRMNFRQFSKN